MKVYTRLVRLAVPLLLAFASAAAVRATDILNISSALTLADASQLGRLSRNGIGQDWAGTEVFPGIINPTVAYRYRTFIIDPSTVALGPFIQISFDSGPDLFASAYANSYNPNSTGGASLGFDLNWLGDAGVSGNAFGVDPVFFQVKVPVGSSLVVVVSNAAAANGGVGAPFSLLVESFSDVDYTPARAGGAVPEAGNAALLFGLGLSALVVTRQLAARE